MGMSCSRPSKLCTYWILLMNLTLAGWGGGRRQRRSPRAAPKPHGETAQGNAHAPYSRAPRASSLQLFALPDASLHPAPLGGWTEQNRPHGYSKKTNFNLILVIHKINFFQGQINSPKDENYKAKRI